MEIVSQARLLAVYNAFYLDSGLNLKPTTSEELQRFWVWLEEHPEVADGRGLRSLSLRLFGKSVANKCGCNQRLMRCSSTHRAARSITTLGSNALAKSSSARAWEDLPPGCFMEAQSLTRSAESQSSPNLPEPQLLD